MRRDDAAVPDPKSQRESQSQGVRESFSLAVEPVWIIAGDRVGVEELNCQIVRILDVVCGGGEG